MQRLVNQVILNFDQLKCWRITKLRRFDRICMTVLLFIPILFLYLFINTERDVT